VENQKETPYKVAGFKLKQLRLERGYSQKEVAGAVDITEGFLSFLESGTKQGSLDTYIALSDLFEYPLPDLFDSGKPLRILKGPTVSLIGLSNKEANLIRATVRALRERRA
jgi:transcriptional regulator with XRE-family HTH domain